LAKLCKHFSNEKKTFPKTENILSKSRQRAEIFNLGPLKDLDEVLALDSAKAYLRKQVTIGRKVTGDLNKNADLVTFQKKSEKVTFPNIHFDILLQIGVESCMI
jgi:hypothetical protein